MFVRMPDEVTLIVKVGLMQTTRIIRDKLTEKGYKHIQAMRLEFRCKILHDDTLLKEYNIENGSTIFAFWPATGGGKNEKKDSRIENIIEIEGNKEEAKNTLNIYEFFRENEQLYEDAKSRIDQSKLYKVYVDGAANTNPGPAGVGYIINL